MLARLHARTRRRKSGSIFNKKISLGKQKGDAKRREEIQARIADIDRRGDGRDPANSGSGGRTSHLEQQHRQQPAQLTTAVAAAAAATSSGRPDRVPTICKKRTSKLAQQHQQQPARNTGSSSSSSNIIRSNSSSTTGETRPGILKCPCSKDLFPACMGARWALRAPGLTAVVPRCGARVSRPSPRREGLADCGSPPPSLGRAYVHSVI
jgi:hypothetical protein